MLWFWSAFPCWWAMMRIFECAYSYIFPPPPPPPSLHPQRMEVLGPGIEFEPAATSIIAAARLDPLTHWPGWGLNPQLYSDLSSCSQILNPLHHSRNSNLFLCLLWRNAYSSPWPLSYSGCLLCCGWVVEFLYILSIIPLSHVWFTNSPIPWVAISLWWLCLLMHRSFEFWCNPMHPVFSFVSCKEQRFKPISIPGLFSRCQDVRD